MCSAFLLARASGIEAEVSIRGRSFDTPLKFRYASPCWVPWHQHTHPCRSWYHSIGSTTAVLPSLRLTNWSDIKITQYCRRDDRVVDVGKVQNEQMDLITKIWNDAPKISYSDRISLGWSHSGRSNRPSVCFLQDVCKKRLFKKKHGSDWKFHENH